MAASRDNIRPSATKENILQYVRNHELPFVTAAKMEGDFPVSKRTILNRLSELEADGEIDRERVGGGAVVWFVSD